MLYVSRLSHASRAPPVQARLLTLSLATASHTVLPETLAGSRLPRLQLLPGYEISSRCHWPERSAAANTDAELWRWAAAERAASGAVQVKNGNSQWGGCAIRRYAAWELVS